MSEAWKNRVVRCMGVKLLNRRVKVGVCRNGSMVFSWRKLEEGRPVETSVRLTDDAALATFACVAKLRGIDLEGMQTLSAELLAENMKLKRESMADLDKLRKAIELREKQASEFDAEIKRLKHELDSRALADAVGEERCRSDPR